MATDINSDELLEQDEAAPRAKKRRNAFATSLDELRTATKKAADAAAEVVDGGDLTRADFAKVFALTKGERASLFPASPRRSVTALSDALGNSLGASTAASDAQADEQANEADGTD